MIDAKEWTPVVREALDEALKERPGEAVVGTRFRLSLDRAAGRHGKTFPPPDDNPFRLGHFLEAFPEILLVQRRPGQDMLIAPAGRPELFVSVRDRSSPLSPGIRQDIFNAWTQISDKRAWYDPHNDLVQWTSADASPPGLIPIPPPTLEQAIEVRRQFAGTLDHPKRDLLETALSSDQPLTLFASVARSQGLGMRWHIFRSQSLAERLAQWAKESGIPWRETWLTIPTSDQTVPISRSDSPVIATSPKGRIEGLATLVEGLNEADLARISVPLDLVLKILSRKTP